MNPAKILVLRGGAIGDFILTLPVLAALRQRFPTARLELVGYSQIAQLAAGWVDDVRSIEAQGLAGFFQRDGALDPEWSDYFSGFSLLISFLFDPEKIFQENVARCASALFVAGPHRPDDSRPQHATEVLLEPLQRLGITHADPVPRLRLVPAGGGPGGHTDSATEHGLWLALHPGSGSERKNWPESYWAELLGTLERITQWRFLLVGGEAEGQRLERLGRLLCPDRFQMLQHRPLPELAARLGKCFGYVGHDSGISHLAAAVGMTGLVLWGDTEEAVWRPRSPRMTVLRDPAGLSHLTVARVLADVQKLFAGIGHRHF